MSKEDASNRKPNWQEIAEQIKTQVKQKSISGKSEPEEGPDGQRLLPIILPKTPPEQTGTAIAFIRSATFGVVKRGRREEMVERRMPAPEGLEIEYTGKRLDQNDLSAFMVACDLYRERSEAGVTRFTMYEILKRLGLKNSGQTQKAVLQRFDRMSMASVRVRVGRKYVAGGLLSLARDKNTDEILLRPNVLLQDLFVGDRWQRIDRDIRMALGSDQLAMWLHSFYSSHHRPYPIKVATLREWCGSETKELRRFRQQLKDAMTRWQRIEPLLSWEIDENDCLVVIKAQKRRAVKGPHCSQGKLPL